MAERMLTKGSLCEQDMCQLLQRIQEYGESSMARMKNGLSVSEGMVTLRKEQANRLSLVRCLNKFLAQSFPDGTWVECVVVPKTKTGLKVQPARESFVFLQVLGG